MSELYWITRLDNIIGVIQLLLVLLVVSIIIMTICYIAFDEDTREMYPKFWEMYPKIKKHFKQVCISALIIIAMLIFIPTTKDAYVIYGVGSIIESPECKKLPDNAVKALNTWLETECKSDSIKKK